MHTHLQWCVHALMMASDGARIHDATVALSGGGSKLPPQLI